MLLYFAFFYIIFIFVNEIQTDGGKRSYRRQTAGNRLFIGNPADCFSIHAHFWPAVGLRAFFRYEGNRGNTVSSLN